LHQRPRRDDDFGFTPREAAFFRRFTAPWRVQRYLDGIEYDPSMGTSCRSPRRVMRERSAQCMDGALFAAAALRFQGYPALIVDLEAEQDTDHVLAVFRGAGGWGAVALSHFNGLRFREPIFRSIRELAVSYFEGYYNLRREKTLRRYSRPVDLARFDKRGWTTAEEDVWYIPEHLVEIRHFPVLSRAALRGLSTVDRRSFDAGLLGYHH